MRPYLLVKVTMKMEGKLYRSATLHTLITVDLLSIADRIPADDSPAGRTLEAFHQFAVQQQV